MDKHSVAPRRWCHSGWCAVTLSSLPSASVKCSSPADGVRWLPTTTPTPRAPVDGLTVTTLSPAVMREMGTGPAGVLMRVSPGKQTAISESQPASPKLHQATIMVTMAIWKLVRTRFSTGVVKQGHNRVYQIVTIEAHYFSSTSLRDAS